MYTVTFYSYKGGVGRTLALANVAYALAAEGGKARVAVVDFDLEAPGIDTVDPFCSEKTTKRGGVLEYIAEYDNNPAPDPRELPSLLPYAREVDGIPNLILIPAGRKDERYQEALTRLNWENFYKCKQGYLFFEQFKRKIEQEFSPDYLLVDSRTGLADVAGITTHQLADLVVLVFNLNRQNLDGIRQCYRSIVSAPKPRPVKVMLVTSPIPEGQFPDDGIVQARLSEAAASMPDTLGYGGGGTDSIIQIPYHPILAVRDITFIKEHPTHVISETYRRLTEAVQKSNPAEMKFLLEKAFRYLGENRFEEAEAEFRSVVEQHPDNAEGRYHYGDFLLKRERNKEAAAQLEEACRLVTNNARYLTALASALINLKRTDSALEKLKRAEELEQTDESILQRISRLYSQQGNTEKALEYWRKLNRSKPPETRLERLQLIQRFTAMRSEFMSAKLNLPENFDRSGFFERLGDDFGFDYMNKVGILSSILAQKPSSQEVKDLDVLLASGAARFSELLGESFATVRNKILHGELQSVYHEEDLRRLVRTEKGTNACVFRLFLAQLKLSQSEHKTAIKIIESALKEEMLDSHKAQFYREWGDALADLSDRESSTRERSQLLGQAAEKYEKALEIRSDDHETLYNWGTVLGELADLKEGTQRESLMEQACEKYAKAVEIRPDDHEALTTWGTALGKLANLKEGAQRKSLMEQACEKFAKAVEIKPNTYETLDNWGNALIQLSYLKVGIQRVATLEAALDKSRRAEAIKPGEGAYNMACAYALLGQKRQALLHLKKALEHNPSARERAAGDEDFRSLRETKSFQRLLAI